MYNCFRIPENSGTLSNKKDTHARIRALSKRTTSNNLSGVHRFYHIVGLTYFSAKAGGTCAKQQPKKGIDTGL